MKLLDQWLKYLLRILKYIANFFMTGDHHMPILFLGSPFTLHFLKIILFYFLPLLATWN